MEDLHNLCLDPFIASVHSSSVSRDEYSVENLSSINPQIHGRGFKVEHFIRPPISIVVEFKFPMHVASILVRPCLEKDAETRLTVEGSHLSEVDSAVLSRGGYQYCLQSGLVAKGPNPLVHLKNDSFHRKWSTKISISRDTVAMVKGSHIQADGVDYASMIEQPLRYINIVSRLKTLSLTFTRLTGPKPFALKWIEVWGTASSTCSMSERVAFETAVQNAQMHMCITAPKTNLYSHHNSHHSAQTKSLWCASANERADRNPSNSLCSGECKTRLLDLQTDSLKCTKPATCTAHDVSPKGSKYEASSAERDNGPIAKRRRMEESTHSLGSEKSLHLPSHRTNSRGPAAQQTNLTIVNSASGGVPRLTTHHFVVDLVHTTSECRSTRLECTDVNPSEPQAIPAKYLDSITYELMLIPMYLPSGHYVDRSTVDKLANNDALYGRKPTDPFTGVAFTEHSKPQFCPELKVEIDEFLTADSFSETVASSRTLGTATDITNHIIQSSGKERRTSSIPNEQEHPVSNCSTSFGNSRLGAPYRQVGLRGCQERSHGSIDKGKQELRGVKDDSFESKVSCSLDDALSQLFSND